MNLSEAIEFGQLVNAAYAIPPGDLVNSAGKALTASGKAYTVVTTIYANDLATEMNPGRGNQRVSIGLICQADGTGDVVIAIRGTEGIMEWVHDAQFLLVTCPFLAGAGQTEDGFTTVYSSLQTDVAPGSPSVANALPTLPFNPPATSLSICGHSLGVRPCNPAWPGRCGEPAISEPHSLFLCKPARGKSIVRGDIQPGCQELISKSPTDSTSSRCCLCRQRTTM